MNESGDRGVLPNGAAHGIGDRDGIVDGRCRACRPADPSFASNGWLVLVRVSLCKAKAVRDD